MEIRIYFEGNKALRPGFEVFFRDVRKANHETQFIAAKDGPSDYRKAARTHPHAWNILLKDSEGPVPTDARTLCKKLGIDPANVNNVFWMVEVMESWFLADPDALNQYYGQGFAASAIGTTQDVERIPKSEVLDRLKRATRRATKGTYNKVTHAPRLLEHLNANRVQEHASNCRKLFDSVRAKLATA
jgi:hypothetical protein